MEKAADGIVNKIHRSAVRKNAQSGIYQIIDSRDLVASTANLDGVTDAGKSLSTLTYRSGAMQGAVPAYGYDGDYSYPGDPTYVCGGYYN